MAFVKKTWLQRIVDFPGRRKLSPTEIPNTYDITRDEGNIIQAGDNMSAVNLNDLENRIEAAVNERIEKIMIVQNAISTNPETVASGPALKAVNDKLTETNNNYAKKVQENWIDATLLNGWTGTLQYAKNELGVVTIKGSLTAGTVETNTNILSLPVGYRPAINIPVLTLKGASSESGHYFYISSNGTLKTPTVVSTFETGVLYTFLINYYTE